MAKKYNPKPHIVELFASEFAKYFYDMLGEHGKLRVPFLGDFSLKRIKERQGWNPIAKELMVIPSYVKIHFKADPKFSRFFNPKDHGNQ